MKVHVVLAVEEFSKIWILILTHLAWFLGAGTGYDNMYINVIVIPTRATCSMAKLYLVISQRKLEA